MSRMFEEDQEDRSQGRRKPTIGRERAEGYENWIGACRNCEMPLERLEDSRCHHINQVDELTCQKPEPRERYGPFGEKRSKESEYRQRACGLCGALMYFDPGERVWDHCLHYLTGHRFDHVARIETATREECEASRKKFFMMCSAAPGDAGKLAMTPVAMFFKETPQRMREPGEEG